MWLMLEGFKTKDKVNRAEGRSRYNPRLESSHSEKLTEDKQWVSSTGFHKSIWMYPDVYVVGIYVCCYRPLIIICFMKLYKNKCHRIFSS